MSARRLSAVVAGLLVALGGWQVGEAGWIHAKAWLAQRLLAAAWHDTLAGNPAAKPWPWADTRPVARLRAPERGIDMIVLAGGSGRSLAFAPGHLDGSPLPGAPGLSVIGGHRDTHFRFLQSLQPGEPLVIEDRAGDETRFRVSETLIVDSRSVRLAPDGTAPALALVTCYPFDAVVPGGPLRYVVFAEVAG